MIEVSGGTDCFVSIPIEDYAEYQCLLKGRCSILDKLEVDGSISVIDLLSELGGVRANAMREGLIKELRQQTREE